jgi:hypothetical protein
MQGDAVLTCFYEFCSSGARAPELSPLLMRGDAVLRLL